MLLQHAAAVRLTGRTPRGARREFLGVYDRCPEEGPTLSPTLTLSLSLRLRLSLTRCPEEGLSPSPPPTLTTTRCPEEGLRAGRFCYAKRGDPAKTLWP